MAANDNKPATTSTSSSHTNLSQEPDGGLSDQQYSSGVTSSSTNAVVCNNTLTHI